MKTIVHLTSSRIYGGPERQMLGLAEHLPDDYQTVFVSFAEDGECENFLNKVRSRGFEGYALTNDTPRFRAVYREMVALLQKIKPHVLLCHGYKAGLIGRMAARRAGIPVIGVSRGWTSESLKVKVYEWLDKLNLRWLDHVVCVSEGQAVKVRRTRVPAAKMSVICNSIKSDRFAPPNAADRELLLAKFSKPVRYLVGSAGRLSPEKGYAVMVAAAAKVVKANPEVGFIVYGDGFLREALQAQIAKAGLEGNFILAGFESNFDRWLPNFDVFVNPSYTEGLANVILESLAARVAVVATAVGGTPEIVEDGVTGYLVSAGDSDTMADRVTTLLDSESQRHDFAEAGFQKVHDSFSYEIQSEQYCRLFDRLARPSESTSRPAMHHAQSGALVDAKARGVAGY